MGLESYIATNMNKEDGLQYLFESISKTKNIYKIIDYTAVDDYNKDVIKVDKIYNLGFTDLDEEFQPCHDATISDNGDSYKVFYTILNTIPNFFDKYPNYAIVVLGSDSNEDFPDTCFPICKKKCPTKEDCKNRDRRVNVYNGYVNRNYTELVKEYTFYGDAGDAIEPFQQKKKYKSIFVTKHNLK